LTTRRNAWVRAVPALVVAATVTLAGCGDPLDPLSDAGGDRIRRQRAIWEAQQIDDYVFETRRLCFCGFVGWVEATVQDDAITSVVSLDELEVPAWTIDEYPTVNELFDILEDAVERNAAEIDVTWHETLGYPEHFYIDYSRNIADEELGNEIRLLTPLP
jgi:hypothetical protein